MSQPFIPIKPLVMVCVKPTSWDVFILMINPAWDALFERANLPPNGHGPADVRNLGL